MKKHNKRILEKQIKKIRDELNRIEYNENCAKFSHLHRKTFKYRNCYSCPKGPGDYWWLYTRVLVIDGLDAIVLTFQVDSYGEARFCPKDNKYAHAFEAHTEISEEEFQMAWAAFRKVMPECI